MNGARLHTGPRQKAVERRIDDLLLLAEIFLQSHGTRNRAKTRTPRKAKTPPRIRRERDDHVMACFERRRRGRRLAGGANHRSTFNTGPAPEGAAERPGLTREADLP